MAVIQELIRIEDNGSLSFGNQLLETKKKILDFEVNGDLYKVKTFKDITKLEKNGLMLFESVPGTTVIGFTQEASQISFTVEGDEDAQITLEMEPDTEYKMFVDNFQVGKVKSNLSGKVTLSVDFKNGAQSVEVKKA